MLLLQKMRKSLFTQIFGDSTKARILNYLIKYRGLDYSMSDIARNAGVSWASLNRNWNELIKFKVIIPTREIGKAKLFKLNEENPAVKDIIAAYKDLLVQETENYFAQEIKVKGKIKITA